MTDNMIGWIIGAIIAALVIYGRRWFFRLRARWCAVSIWVDSERGDDSQPGCRGLPLRTLGELARRVEGSRMPGDLDVYLTGEFPDEDLRLHCEVPEHAVACVSGEPVGWWDRAQHRVWMIWARLNWKRWARQMYVPRGLFRFNATVGDLDIRIDGNPGHATIKNVNIRRQP